MNRTFGVIIIGGGIVGTAAARELSRYSSSVLLLEQAPDVSMGATRANSGIVHGGYTAPPGTLKGELSVRGNRMFSQLSEELGFPFRRIGSCVLAFSSEDQAKLQMLLENGRRNGIDNLELISGDAVRKREPRVSPEAVEALYCGDTGIVSPYEAAAAFAENAVENGVTLKLNHEVTAVEHTGAAFKVTCRLPGEEGTVSWHGEAVINAAGLFSDRIAATAGADSFTIRPRRGEYLLLQRGSAERVGGVIFQAPSAKGKGVLVSPTTWGNLLIGPNAEDTEDREDTSGSYEALRGILQQARMSIPDLQAAALIRYFTGIRAASDRSDFIIGPAGPPGYFQAAGIESPGLTSAPAIAVLLRDLLNEGGFLGSRKSAFQPVRPPVTLPGNLLPYAKIKDQINLPEGDLQRIVCRCEQVREETIADAVNRRIPIDSLDAVKRRTRAGMGPCQGAFCAPRVKSLLMRLTGLEDQQIRMPEPKDADLLKRLRKL